ncbi:MAG: hypothetical protein E6767_14255 [Dysgonomonas sp.]|nr:hypothetical protein [Dysgonomonas sp.]
MKQLTIFFLSLLLLSISREMTAQVTIGMDEAPLTGALLQLKNKKNNATDNTNASKGLGLPRVALNADATSVVDVDAGFLSSLGLPIPALAADRLNMATTHEGLTIYNTTEKTITSSTNLIYMESRICPGMYVWLGDKWKRAMADVCQ